MELIRGAAGVRCLRAPSPPSQQALLAPLLSPSLIHAYSVALKDATITGTKDVVNGLSKLRREP